MNKITHLTSIIITLFLFLQVEISVAQTDSIPAADTIAQDSVTEVKKPSKTKPYNFRRSFKEDYPHPKTATYAALIIPGAGQAYNKDWWKIPIVWAAYGGIGYSIYFHYTQYKLFDKRVVDYLANPMDFPGVNVSVLRDGRDYYRKYLEYSYLGAVLIHVLAATEAYVAAHFKKFDITDELSLRITPQIQAYPGNLQPMQAGVAMHFSF